MSSERNEEQWADLDAGRSFIRAAGRADTDGCLRDRNGERLEWTEAQIMGGRRLNPLDRERLLHGEWGGQRNVGNYTNPNVSVREPGGEWRDASPTLNPPGETDL